MTAALDIPVPANVRWLAELVGADAALRLIEKHGGTRVYVPKDRLERSELVKTTGLSAKVLLPLSRARGGELLALPLCREWRVRLYRQRDRMLHSEIAQRLGITERAVRRLLLEGGMTGEGNPVPATQGLRNAAIALQMVLPL